MKARPKAVLRNTKNMHGQQPIAIRVTVNGTQKFIPVKEVAAAEQWNTEMGLANNKHPDTERINDKIIALKKRIDAFASTLDCPKEIAAETIVTHFKEPLSTAPTDKSDFFKYTDLFVMRYSNENTLNQYTATLKVLEGFIGKRVMPWSHVSREKMSDFQRYLIRKKYSGSTQKKIFTHLKNIFNQALIELSQSQQFNDTPFAGLTFEKETVAKVRLNSAEIKSVRQVTDNRTALAKDVFLFAWNMGGMRISDLCTLKWNQISPEGFLTYQMRKTRKTKGTRIMELSFEAKEILSRYRGITPEFIFPLLKEGDTRSMHSRIQQVTTEVNRKLKLLSELADLRKTITTHVSRRSWANVALEKGADIRDVQNVFGHSALSTTAHYVAGMENSQISNINLRIVQ